MTTEIILKIRRSQSNNEPTILSNGELAYSFSSNKLFIGKTPTANSAVSVEYIGGKLIVDKVANLETVLFGGGGQGSFFNLSVSANASIDQLILTTFSNNGVLFSKAGGLVDFVTGYSGQILQIAANGTPVFDDLNGGTY